MSRLVVESRPHGETRKQRRDRLKARQLALKTATSTGTNKPGGLTGFMQVGEFPNSAMPTAGWKSPHGLRGETRVEAPDHRASSRVLAAAYPFLAESGELLRGAYIGQNMLARSPFCFDPWEAYEDGVIKSHSAMILGVKGTGKSMLAKSWACRLARLGRFIAVPHDPNGEWVRVAEYVGGKSIRFGGSAKINLLDVGERDTGMTDAEWGRHVLQERRATVKAVILQLRNREPITPFEHTAIDDALQALTGQAVVTVVHVYEQLQTSQHPDGDVKRAAHALGHTMRRMVAGDLAGMFDGESTVVFDTSAPMMVVDTSTLKTAAPDMQALSRLATARWVRNATNGSNRRARVIVHEEAAVALMNDVSGGAGLTERVADEKVARHLGTSNWYLLHRLSDLDALGDEGSAVRTQALGLLADCETRVSYQQHPAEIARSTKVLGWNTTMGKVVRGLKKGEGLWQLGQDRTVLVKNKMTPREFEVFRTDTAGVS